MTIIILSAVFITSVLLLSVTPVAGLIGDACTVDNPCLVNEVCGAGGTCECVTGYEAIGKKCGRECPPLGDISNGSVTIVPNAQTVEFEAIYTCNNGFDLVGPPKRRCQNETGSWEGSAPTCVEKDDPCKPNPCPLNTDNVPYSCSPNTDNLPAYVCICPNGLKGNTCSEDDPALTCRDSRIKRIHFENNPSLADRTACMPKKNSTEENVCYNPNEDITYVFEDTADVSADNSNEERFCLTYTETPPDVEKTCVNITAFETDDILFRPWINETFEMCFRFNVKPVIFLLPQSPLRYNIANMPGTVTVQLQARDQDVNQTLAWDISAVSVTDLDGKFSINEGSLEITNPSDVYATNPDIFGPIFDIEITVTDDGVPALQDSRNISIQFVNAILTCIVPDEPFLVHLEPFPTSKVNLGQIKCTADGQPQTPQFEIMNNAGPILIESDGTIFYDPDAIETRGKFNIDVKANTTVTIPVFTTFKFSVIAKNFNPFCNRTAEPYPVSLNETTTYGNCNTNVIFICDDRANLTKTCSDSSDLFDVQCNSVLSNITEVTICAADSLRSLAGTTETVSVEVLNEYGSITIEINVIISNVNDPPVFSPDTDQIDLEIPENTNISTIVKEIAVADEDIEKEPFFDILTVTITDLESIENAASLPFGASVGSLNRSVTLTLEKELNPKVRDFYLLELKVEDAAGASDTVTINITVKDVNEKPTCDTLKVNASVTVRDTVDYVVTSLTCTDDDFSEPYRTLSYTLEGGTVSTEYFKINNNGVIQLKKDLTSFTSGTEISFTARVTDGGGLSETVQITVDVTNDYPPVCTSSKFDVTKSETTDADVCFGVAVGCADPVRNETLEYTITSGNGTALFYEKDSTYSQMTICTAKALQGLYGTWKINAAVKSSYGETIFAVIIRVSDKNDKPVFTFPVYNKTVFENATIGTVVFTVQASDQDSGAYGRLTYHSPALDESGLFSLDTNSGEISVVSQLDADFIASNVYSFEVEAKDGASSPLSASANVSIQVLDVNDEKPICDPVLYSTTINLLSNVGTLIQQLACTDADKTPEFRTLEYSTTSSYFSVNNTGHVILTSNLLRNVTKYDIEIKVTDSDNSKGFTTSVNITVFVDNKVPPICDPNSVIRSLDETEQINVCLEKEVICTDPTGGEVTLQSQTGTAQDNGLLVIKLHSDDSGKLGLSACINSSLKDKFGTYTLIGTVSNSLGIATINWTFTVVNVNEAPLFTPDVYNITIPESQTSNQEILRMTVSDPDDGKGNSEFELLDVTVVSSNDAEFDDALSDSVWFLGDLRAFYASREFNATVRNVYAYVATAVDKSGLKSTASVTIHIDDVNSAPVCQPSIVYAKTDILVKENSVLAQLSCYDTDIKPEFVQLDYTIFAGDQGGYFNITPLGELIVQKPLPRYLLYSTGKADIRMKISDRGTPPLSTDVTISVTVDNTIPPTCKPVIIPPDIWVQNKCVTIKMDCTDPTKEGTNHLDFSTFGNFTSGFTEKSNSLGTIELCYNLIKSGIFEISVSVDNGLGIYTFTDSIVVSYSKASPVFSSSKYTDVISETTEINTIVMIVDASSADLVGSLEYNILGSESTDGWQRYFSLNSNSGEIRTLAGIKELANQMISLKVEAVDTISKLRSSVPVELTIQDLNEQPACAISSTTLNLEVDSAVDNPVVVFNCSDPDVKEEYRTLNYTISGPDAGTYFKLVGNPPTSVAIKTPLNVQTKEYIVTLTVNDKGEPALFYTRDFKVNVNTLPPPVEVEAGAVSFDTINVIWKYSRPDYYEVTNSFKVKTLNTENIIVKESSFIDPGTLTYNVTGLAQKTEYIIVVEANTDVGSRSSKGLRIATTEVPVLTYFTATIVAKKDYNERLRDRLSQIYYEYRLAVIENVEFILQDVPGFVGITAVSFRPYNSVLADIQGSVNQDGNVDTVIQKLNQTVSTGWVNLLSVQSGFFQASAGAGYITIDAVTFTPDKVYNGTVLDFTCNITAIGYATNENFTYWWTYRRNQLQPTSQSRYRVSVSTNDVFYEYKHSALRVNPILSDNSGLYGCHVKDSANRHVKEKLIEIEVQSQPVVYITPKSLTVNLGGNVNVTCGVAVSSGIFERFIWFKNGNQFEGSSNEIISLASTSTTIRVIGIQQNVVYGCEGVNEAGKSERVTSNIGVISQEPTEEEFCPKSADGRGTTWPMSAADTIARDDCNTDFMGEIYRVCTAKGIWEPPVYDCVRREIEDIEQQVIDIKDGSRPLNLTQVLVDLNQATADKTLFEGDIDTTINALGTAVGITDDSSTEEKTARKTNFIETCSSLIDIPNAPAWQSSIEVRQKGAIDVPRLVEEYNDKVLDTLSNDSEEPVTVKNIHINIGSGKKEKYVFPDRSGSVPEWVASTKTGIVIQGEAFKDVPTVRYAGSFFRNITPILVKKLIKDGVVSDPSLTYDINADIVAFQLKENKSLIIDPPAEITFQHFDSNYSDPICCYWDFEEEAFVTDGCTLVSSDDELTVCHCSHFTNFALLMSPGKTPEADVMALSIISAVGCAISILCLLLTIILYALVWRLVKSDRAVLLLNLCVALIISYIIFLAGVDRAENKHVCTAISALLHYFYLVVFFLMLAYGIEIGISVVYVFVTRSRIKWLLPLAWGIPLVIVGISLGVTQLDGYGNERFCWLSTEDGLFWAFAGPAALIILINFVIVIIVLRQMCTSSAMMTKSDKEKAVIGVRSLCVLLPILGLTWVFGVFSVNKDLVVFQYIFAICNTLQGFFIFLFHCIFNRQLKQALKQRHEKKKSLANIEYTFKNPQSTTGSTGYFSSDGRPNQNNNANNGTSNPFLEADRQMKELVGKNKKVASVNDNVEANNKVEVEKNSKAVDLDDVKISNIIRESEVMGGMSGVSSILQVENSGDANKNKEAPMDAPRATSQRYDYIDPYHMESAPSTGIQKPSGYEKLLQGTSQGMYASKDSVQTGSDRSKEREKEKQRDKEREREREIERERQKRIEKEKRGRFEKERLERERMEKENEDRERREMEQREKDRYKDRGVIRIGYANEGYSIGDERRRDGSHERRGISRSERSSRTDDDYESGAFAQNITSISTALPEKFELYQGKKRKQKEAKKQAESSLKRKDKKKSSLKDRSKAYEYSYESTYLGGQSRHASLESMNMQNLGYSPYVQVPGYAGYQAGRPVQQQQHWDQYGYARGQRNPRDAHDPYGREPYRREYW